MKKLIRSGLAAGIAGALALAGVALAQGSSQSGSSGATGSGSGTPSSAGQGGTSQDASKGSGTMGSPSGTTGGATGSSDTSATGGGGATAGSNRTMTGSSSAGEKIDPKLQSKLEKLHADNQAEVKLAELAAQTAQSPQVKQFAQKMQTDHQRLDGKLTQTAQAMGVSLEGKDYQKEAQDTAKTAEKLQSKSGAEFDKAYMSQMVKDHKSDIKAVESAQKDAQKGQHTELASLLQQAHQGMQHHLTMAQQVEKSLGKGGSARSGQGETSSGTGSSSGMGSSSGTGSSGSQSKPSTGQSKPGTSSQPQQQ